MNDIKWHSRSINDMSAFDLYQLIALRVDVFVVEQNCPYPELDHIDTLEGVEMIWAEDSKGIIACARIIPAGVSYPDVSIGRVAIARRCRNTGLGHTLIKYALNTCQERWGETKITIGAQAHLQSFYQQHGFKTCSEEYLEDGIPHVKMSSTRN